MHQVKRAIIMAAGIGKRMQPVTLAIPKPLVKVNGTRMIDTVIQGLHANGITEIYVVVGYLKEQFECLEREYDGLKLIENPWYDVCNNISSLYVARNHIENAIILDGDQIIYNQNILATEFEKSGYNAVWTDENTLRIFGGQRYQPVDTVVEGDWSNAAFLEGFSLLEAGSVLSITPHVESRP